MADSQIGLYLIANPNPNHLSRVHRVFKKTGLTGATFGVYRGDKM